MHGGAESAQPPGGVTVTAKQGAWAATQAARLRTWKVRHRTALRSMLAAYGIVVALFGVAHAGAPGEATTRPIHGTRSGVIQSLFPVVAKGGPPLLGRIDDRIPAGYGDDKGIYIYLETVSRVTGNRDVQSLLHWWFFAPTLALLLALYPLVFAELFGSLAAGVAAPLLLLAELPRVQLADFYWMSAWAPLFGIPLVLLAFRRSTTRRLPLWLTLIVLVAGAASTFRSNAGLGVVIAAALAALFRIRGWRQCAAVLAVLAVAYVGTSNTLVTGVRTERDRALGIPNFDVSPVGHPFWFPAYQGLGYLAPNRHGITWDDSAAYATVRRIDPNAVYGSPRFEAILRHLYLHILRTDPGFIVHVYFSKALVTMKSAGGLLWVLPVAAAMAFLGGRSRRRYLVMALPAVPVGIGSPILGVPLRSYALGWYASLVLLLILTSCWVLSAGLRVAFDRATWTTAGSALGRPGPRAIVGAVAAAATSILIALVPAAGKAVEVELYWRDLALKSPKVKALPKAVVARWQMTAGFPSGWVHERGAEVGHTGRETTVTTGLNMYFKQLESPTLDLRPGPYVAVVRGAVPAGALAIGALDMTANAWINSTFHPFSRFEVGDQGGTMAASFTVPTSRPVRIVLLNWVTVEQRSRWRLTAVELRRGTLVLAKSVR